MAWELVSKPVVARLAAVKEQELDDEWYDMAIGIIEHISGQHNLGSTTTVTETLDGRGWPRLSVKQPPISSVVYVKVGGDTVDSSTYTHDKNNIIIKDDASLGGNPYVSGDTFTKGRMNVEVSYVSGDADPPKNIAMAVALIVKELANMRTLEGSESRLQFYRPDRQEGVKDFVGEFLGTHGKIASIVKTLVGKRFRVA